MTPASLPDDTSRVIDGVVEKYGDELVDLRRDLHAHPELSFAEERTTDLVESWVREAGFRVSRPTRTGLVAEIGEGERAVGLRADLDALPVEDTTEDPWASTVGGVAHACGHDVHTAGLVGAALAIAEVAGRGDLRGRARLIFQPAEEVMPGGALELLEHGVLGDLDAVFGLHCDPSIDVGTIGLREGPLTGAADKVEVRLHGSGGHTSRPHLTQDLTYALAKLVTELPSILSRRLDPRAGVSVVWGMVQAGAAPNVVPATGRAAATIRMLDSVAWADAERLVRELIPQIVAPYQVRAEILYHRGVPPVVNDHRATAVLGRAVESVVGEVGHVPTSQSLGGEDFGWFLDHVPGAMARLGTRTPGGPTYDLHQGNLRVDDQAVLIGARVLAAAAVQGLSDR
ncbi:amidohydrolase [Nocardioides rotundus]|uniref:amidohydrolase n=1 Tax=Nocardioides rotundus TaxID=1774216 RepID=UPI001CBBB606|nr:amidohydrolase [Nocardioides rotundus]